MTTTAPTAEQLRTDYPSGTLVGHDEGLLQRIEWQPDGRARVTTLLEGEETGSDLLSAHNLWSSVLAPILRNSAAIVRRNVVETPATETPASAATLRTPAQTIATTLTAALSVAAEEGRAWGDELIANEHGDAAAVLPGIERDPSGWYVNCAFTTVQDQVSDDVWTAHRDQLERACADAAARRVREVAG